MPDRRLEIDGISKRYGETVALRDASFEVRAGELFGFVGSNGAGKTTAMRIVLGVLAADAGSVRWGGGGADIGPLMRAGVPGLSIDTVGEHYFDWHHTQADTLDKVSPADLQRAVALFAWMGYALADRPERLLPAAGTK